MTTQKISVSLDSEKLLFLQMDQQRNEIRSRSEVVGLALQALREVERQRQYREALLDHERNGEAALWDVTSGDGITADGEAAAW